MKAEDHEAECLEKLGTRFELIHKWLDEFAGTAEYGMRHRKLRHHEEGIRRVREKWGDDAADAARLHIISDLKEEGWSEGDHFPVNDKDYVKMGLF